MYHPHYPVLSHLTVWYQRFINCFSNLQSLLLFFTRLIWGHQFFIYGMDKFSRIESVIQFYHSIHLPFAAFSAYLLATLEVVGGILLLVGFFSRGIAFLLALDMIFVISTQHIHMFFNLHFLMDPYILLRERAFLFFVACLFILIFGPGRLSLDGWIKRGLKRRHLLD